jgi:hypothetical protein
MACPVCGAWRPLTHALVLRDRLLACACSQNCAAVLSDARQLDWPPESMSISGVWSATDLRDARLMPSIFAGLHPEMGVRSEDLDAWIDALNAYRPGNVYKLFWSWFMREKEPADQTDLWVVGEIIRSGRASPHALSYWLTELVEYESVVTSFSSSINKPLVMFARVRPPALVQTRALASLVRDGETVVIKSQPFYADAEALKTDVLNKQFPRANDRRKAAVAWWSDFLLPSFMMDALFALHWRDLALAQLIPYTPHLAIGVDAFAGPDLVLESAPPRAAIDTSKPRAKRLYLVSERADVSLAQLRVPGRSQFDFFVVALFQAWTAFETLNRYEGWSHGDAHDDNIMLRDVTGTPYAGRNWLYLRQRDPNDLTLHLYRLGASAHRNRLVEFIDFGLATATRIGGRDPASDAEEKEERERFRYDLVVSLQTGHPDPPFRNPTTASDIVRKAEEKWAASDARGIRRRLTEVTQVAEMLADPASDIEQSWCELPLFRSIAGVEYVGTLDEEGLEFKLRAEDLLVAMPPYFIRNEHVMEVDKPKKPESQRKRRASEKEGGDRPTKKPRVEGQCLACARPLLRPRPLEGFCNPLCRLISRGRLGVAHPLQKKAFAAHVGMDDY